MSPRLMVVTAALALAACDKPPASVPASGATMAATRLPYFSSYETWCGRMGKGVCKGDWGGHDPGTSALGPYRFVGVEYAEQRDGEGPVLEVFFELVTPKGNVYLDLGGTRKARVTTSVLVHGVVDHPGAVELQTVYRTSPRFTQSDYHTANFILEGSSGLSAVQVPLGKITGDDTGKSEGVTGTAVWHEGKLSLKGAAMADGEWAVTLP